MVVKKSVPEKEQSMEPGLRVVDAMQRVKGVFLEIPGTRLTPAETARLSGLDSPLCRFVLAALEDAQFLRRGRDGLYARRTSDSIDS
jgi:hypothetical protein